MKLIVGLGNFGGKYDKTRHNLGFIILDQFLKDTEPVNKTMWEDNPKFKSDIFVLDWQRRSASSGQAKEEKVILVKPKTLMNNSGLAVSLISAFYKIKLEDIWIVHDELDLPLGTMKIRLGGAAAGHHGVESIIESLKSEKFYRFRMGIGQTRGKEEIEKHKIRKADEFVLDKFNSHEAGTLKHLIKKGSEALSMALEKDIKSAMNRFNTK